MMTSRLPSTRTKFVLAVMAAVPLLMAGGVVSLSPFGDSKGLSLLAGAIVGVIMSKVLPRLIEIAVTDFSTQVQGSAEKMREMIRRQAAAIDSQAHVIEQMQGAIMALEKESRSIAEECHTLAQDSNQSARMSESGDGATKSVETSIQGVGQTVDMVATTNANIDRLGDQVEMILGYLDHLTTEMKSLSTDAETEGEPDAVERQKFQLVATEIRQLVELSMEASRDILERIEEVRTSSSRAVEATTESSKTIEQSLESFANMESGWNKLRTSTSANSSAAYRIEELAARQSITLAGMSESLSAMRRQVGESQDESFVMGEVVDELAVISA